MWFQSLIGILADFNLFSEFKSGLDFKFQSLIGILADFNIAIKSVNINSFVSIPDRDFS